MAGARTEKPDARTKPSGRTGSRTVPAASLSGWNTRRERHASKLLRRDQGPARRRGAFRLPSVLASVMPPNPAAIPTRLESPMRKPTPADAEILMRLYEIRRDPELRRARQWFLTEFKAAEWSEIKAGYLKFADEDRWFRMTTSYWEMVGSMVNREVLHPELFFDHTAADLVAGERCKR